MSRRRQGFTLVELAICLTLLALLIPLVYAFARDMEDRTALGLSSLETADAVRTVSETLRQDARSARWTDPTGLTLRRADGCEVRYLVKDSVLMRKSGEPCAGPHALARRVTSMERVTGGVEVVFSLPRRPGPTEGTQVKVRIPVEVVQ